MGYIPYIFVILNVLLIQRLFQSLQIAHMGQSTWVLLVEVLPLWPVQRTGQGLLQWLLPLFRSCLFNISNFELLKLVHEVLLHLAQLLLNYQLHVLQLLDFAFVCSDRRLFGACGDDFRVS